MKGKYCYADYAPLSKAAEKRILHYDRDSGFGPEGSRPNRNRFYLYLTQRGSDVQVRTVAVKAPKRTDAPCVKEVGRTSVDDPMLHLLDLVYVGMAGYVVDWSPQGFGPCRYWDYNGRWVSEEYSLRCMWKIDAPVVNPELLRRTRRFRWSAWRPENGHILDYLKIYNSHPGIEFLSKQGLGQYCTKVSLVRKLEKDRKFLQFFGKHADQVRAKGHSVPEILRAYRKGISLEDSRLHEEARRKFRGMGLPSAVDPRKAIVYAERKRLRLADYVAYLKNCVTVGLDLEDTKVAFPVQFNVRCEVVQDQVDVIRAKESAAKNIELNRKLERIAGKWMRLEANGRAFRILLPRTVDDFTAEGKELRNCLGESYAAKVARGDVLVVFVRRADLPETAFVAVEYDLKQNRISQCYGYKNSRPDEKVRKFVERAFRNVTEQKQVAA